MRIQKSITLDTSTWKMIDSARGDVPRRRAQLPRPERRRPGHRAGGDGVRRRSWRRMQPRFVEQCDESAR